MLLPDIAQILQIMEDLKKKTIDIIFVMLKPLMCNWKLKKETEVVVNGSKCIKSILLLFWSVLYV